MINDLPRGSFSRVWGLIITNKRLESSNMSSCLFFHSFMLHFQPIIQVLATGGEFNDASAPQALFSVTITLLNDSERSLNKKWLRPVTN